MFLWNAFFLILPSTFWGLDWTVAKIIGLVMATLGLLIGIWLLKLKKWALYGCVGISLFNLIWIGIERILFLNRYVVALVINIGDYRRCYFMRLITEPRSEPGFINRFSSEMSMSYHFPIGLTEQFLAGIFYGAVLFYLTQPKKTYFT